MQKPGLARLSRRERQIMEILYKLGRASAAEVRTALADAPSYSAVRSTLRLLEEKGYATHEERGLRYVFVPTVPREKARRAALKHLLETFFQGSAEQAVATLLDVAAPKLSQQELDRLSRLIEQTGQERKE